MTLTLAPTPILREDTPGDYWRLGFDGSTIPSKKIVGLLACQRDPLLRKLLTTIHSARPAAIAAPPPQKGKANKKKGSGSAPPSGATSGTATPNPSFTPAGATGSAGGSGSGTPAGRLWEVELLDTVIFPEGGGQPADTGLLHLLDPNGGKETPLVVEGCLRKKLDSVHLVRVPAEMEGVLESAVGKEVEVEVDWDRRMDHMSLHTAQHLLSAVLDTKSLPTLSWSMTAHPSLETPYVELPRALTWAEAQEVEDTCNRLIAEAKRVWIDVSVQVDGGETGEGDRESRGIPKDYAGGVIRHVNIDATDRNACCGTQLPHLGLCTHLHVLPPSTASSATTPASLVPTKLYFTAGPRALRFLDGASRSLSLAAQALACSRGNVVERAEQADAQRKELIGASGELKKELAKWVTEKALAQVLEKENGNLVWVHRTERATHDFDFLSTVSATFTASASSSASGSASATADPDKPLPEPVIVLSSAPAEARPALLVVHSKDDKLAKAIKDKLAAALDQMGEDGAKGRVKGGGAKGRYMCKVDGKWGKKETERFGEVVNEIREKGI